MKLIKPYYEIIEPTGYTIEDVYKSIELAGKVSHKSEHTIKEGSAKEFVDRIINWGHNSCLEFGTIYLHISVKDSYFDEISFKYSLNEYSIVTRSNTDAFISSNYRVLVENNWLDDLKYLCKPTKYHVKRYCVKFVCSRSISHEFVRHRKFSFMQESQRYCRYSSNKFNNELTFIIPCWLDIPEGKAYFHDGINFRVGVNEENLFGESVNPKAWNRNSDWKEVYSFLHSLEVAEYQYFKLLSSSWKPEQAREVLPNATKTELYMCGFSSAWEDFFRLRGDKQHAHPQAYELAHPLHEEFINRGYITK